MHLLRKFSLSRRTMLKGLIGGSVVAVGLPPLEAMFNAHGDAHADGSALPRRFVMWMGANGFLLSRFEPSTTGTTWELTPQLEPLADVKSYVNLCTGFENRGIVGGLINGHVEGITAYNGYTYVLNNYSYTYDAGGPTIDQLIADRIADETITAVRSLQVGISKSNLFVGTGNLGSAFSFRGEPGAITPLPPMFDPTDVWQTLFGLYPGPNAPADDRELRKSMLDAIQAQTDRLRPKLGALDNQRLDAHLDGIYELEQKISVLPPPCVLPEEPTEHNAEAVGAEHVTDVTQIMAQLVAYALQCDITRVASVVLLGLAGETPWTEAGLSATQHTLSHDAQYNPASLEQYHNGIVYQMERLADFVGVLKDTVDPTDANLLDSTIVYASSDTSVGWLHSVARQPVILIGTGGGYLKYPGIHVQSIENNATDPDGANTPYMPTAANTSDILLTCLRAWDSSADSVGGGQAMSDDPLTDVLA